MTSQSPLAERLDRLLWHTDPRKVPAWQRSLIQLARLLFALFRDMTQGFLNLQAMSLVYTTLLSLVPLLAVSFSVLKGFGVHNQLEPMLLNTLAPLGDKSQEITARIIGFVDNIRVGVLGSLGLALLLYTVISLIQKIEEAFNYTWHVDKPRSFARRFSQYLSVLLVGPVLFFTAVGLTASVRSNAFVQAVVAVEPMGTLLELLGRLVPYLMISAAFAFVYLFVPNTRVRLRSALVGALVAGALWQTVGWGFATFMASSTRYTAIYSGFAIPILFMMWVYIAWLILLIGASIAFYHQHPEYLAARTRELHLSGRTRESLALSIAREIARSHYLGEPPRTIEGLATALATPGASIESTLKVLERGGLVLATTGEPPGYVPAKPPESIPVADLVRQVRCFAEGTDCCAEVPSPEAVEAVEARIEGALDDALAGITLKDLVGDLAERGMHSNTPPGPLSPG